jgi:hypothetical protein
VRANSIARLLKSNGTLSRLHYSPLVSGMFQVTITVRIVAKTTSKPIALRCVLGFSIFFSWHWPAQNALSHRKMHEDAYAADRLHLPVVRPCAIRYMSALSALPEIASPDS